MTPKQRICATLITYRYSYREGRQLMCGVVGGMIRGTRVLSPGRVKPANLKSTDHSTRKLPIIFGLFNSRYRYRCLKIRANESNRTAQAAHTSTRYLLIVKFCAILRKNEKKVKKTLNRGSLCGIRGKLSPQECIEGIRQLQELVPILASADQLPGNENAIWSDLYRGCQQVLHCRRRRSKKARQSCSNKNPGTLSLVPIRVHL